jgi:hypothetical protein
MDQGDDEAAQRISFLLRSSVWSNQLAEWHRYTGQRTDEICSQAAINRS